MVDILDKIILLVNVAVLANVTLPLYKIEDVLENNTLPVKVVVFANVALP